MWRLARAIGRFLGGGAAASVLALLCGLVVGTVGAAASVEALGVRIGEHGDKTRFVLDLGANVSYRVFTLADPYRVVIDLPELRWAKTPRQPTGTDRLVARYRYGLFRPGTYRLVLDLAAPATVAKDFVLAAESGAPYRLVLDLVTADRTAFLAAIRARPPSPVPETATPPVGQLPRRADGKRVVALDPGHGGVDPGAIGRSGIYEKKLVLSQARAIAKALEATGRYKVVLTRERDVFVRLRDRVAFARTKGAELFISVHADTIKNPKVRGSSVYTLSETASDEEAAALAAKENKSDIIAGVDLSDESNLVANILIDLAQRETMNLSARYAGLLAAELGKTGKLLRKTHRFAGFAVLKAPDVASVLLELGYLSSRKDEKLLRSKSNQKRIGLAVLKATDKFFKEMEQASQ